MAKASSLTLVVLTPVACAATSSSRIAAQARPSRELSSRWNSDDHDDDEHQQQVPVLQLVQAPGDVRSARGGSPGAAPLATGRGCRW